MTWMATPTRKSPRLWASRKWIQSAPCSRRGCWSVIWSQRCAKASFFRLLSLLNHWPLGANQGAFFLRGLLFALFILSRRLAVLFAIVGRLGVFSLVSGDVLLFHVQVPALLHTCLAGAVHVRRVTGAGVRALGRFVGR